MQKTFEKIKLLKRKIRRKLFGVVSLKTNRPRRGLALLSYMTYPFVHTTEHIKNNHYHTNYWECAEIARLLLERGFDVDVIDAEKEILPKKSYDVVIDTYDKLEQLLPSLKAQSIKIFLATTAFWKFNNEAELSRIEAVKKRKSVALSPKRALKETLSPEIADMILILGNEFTKKTYAHLNKPIVQIPISTTLLFPEPSKDWTSCRKSFVWFGGGGAVHKGLDLVLEAFSKTPEYNLSVCGPMEESDFVEAYGKELYKLPNIKTYGRIKINEKKFQEIARQSVAVVYPSCSEGGGGSVITMMHAGCIPIVGREASVDVADFGFVLKNAESISEIMDIVKMVSELPTDEIKKRSLASWDYARKHHTREVFSKTFSSFLDSIISKI